MFDANAAYKAWLERAYDATAASRDDSRWRNVSAEHDALERHILNAGRPSIGDRVLELGCGTGTLTRKLAHAVGARGRVEAIDLSTEMLREAMTHFMHPAIEFRKADFDSIDLDASSFDSIYSKWAVELSSDVRALLRKMVCGLTATGRLVVLTVGDPACSTVSRAARFIRHGFFAPADESHGTPSAFALASEARLVETAHWAGLGNAAATSYVSRIAFSSLAELVEWLCETQGPIKGLLRRLPVERRVEAKAALSEFLSAGPESEAVASQQSILLAGSLR